MGVGVGVVDLEAALPRCDSPVARDLVACRLRGGRTGVLSPDCIIDLAKFTLRDVDAGFDIPPEAL